MEQKVKEVLKRASFQLKQAGICHPAFEAEILLSHALHKDRIYLYAGNPIITEEKIKYFNKLINRRCKREPLAYLTEKKEFLGRDFLVSPAVLIPRPETELLIEYIVMYINKYNRGQQQLHILDLGTGGGVIAVSLALILPQARVCATDISSAALEIAQKNAFCHRVNKQISFFQGDFFNALPHHMANKFDVIVSNPPYVLSEDLPFLAPEIQKEPIQALNGGEDGLYAYQKIIKRLPDHLGQPGLFALELGWKLDQAVQKLCINSNLFTKIKIYQDYNKINRYILCCH